MIAAALRRRTAAIWSEDTEKAKCRASRYRDRRRVRDVHPPVERQGREGRRRRSAEAPCRKAAMRVRLGSLDIGVGSRRTPGGPARLDAPIVKGLKRRLAAALDNGPHRALTFGTHRLDVERSWPAARNGRADDGSTIRAGQPCRPEPSHRGGPFGCRYHSMGGSRQGETLS